MKGVLEDSLPRQLKRSILNTSARYIAGADPEFFSRGGGVSEPLTLNFNMQKSDSESVSDCCLSFIY